MIVGVDDRDVVIVRYVGEEAAPDLAANVARIGAVILAAGGEPEPAEAPCQPHIVSRVKGPWPGKVRPRRRGR